MGSITQGGGGFNGVARRAVQSALTGGEGAPTIADLIGGVNRHLNGQRAVLPGMTVTPMSAYAPGPAAPGPSPTPAPAPNGTPRDVYDFLAAHGPSAPSPGMSLATNYQRAMAGTPGVGGTPTVADLIRQIRQIQGM